MLPCYRASDSEARFGFESWYRSSAAKSLPQIAFNQAGKADSLSPELAKFLMAIELDPADERRLSNRSMDLVQPENCVWMG